MRPGSGQSTVGKPRLGTSNWNVLAKIAAVVVICHLLSVIIFSAQSTAAGGPLILFPIATLWQQNVRLKQASMSHESWHK